jgi:hypothetical protein
MPFGDSGITTLKSNCAIATTNWQTAMAFEFFTVAPHVVVRSKNAVHSKASEVFHD